MQRLHQLHQMLNDDPDNTFVLFAIAQEYQQGDDIEQAIASYEKLKSVDHKYVGLYYHLAKCYTLTESRQQALVTYDEGIAVANSLQDTHALAELKNAKLNYEMDLS